MPKPELVTITYDPENAKQTAEAIIVRRALESMGFLAIMNHVYFDENGSYGSMPRIESDSFDLDVEDVRQVMHDYATSTGDFNPEQQ